MNTLTSVALLLAAVALTAGMSYSATLLAVRLNDLTNKVQAVSLCSGEYATSLKGVVK